MSDQETLRERLKVGIKSATDRYSAGCSAPEVLDAILPIVQAELAALREQGGVKEFVQKYAPSFDAEVLERAVDLRTAELRKELAARDERISKLRSRFIDLADDFEKHGNDRLRHIDPAERLGGAVEGVCADRIRALLAEAGK